jgi:cytidyltransferase-like protein
MSSSNSASYNKVNVLLFLVSGASISYFVYWNYYRKKIVEEKDNIEERLHLTEKQVHDLQLRLTSLETTDLHHTVDMEGRYVKRSDSSDLSGYNSSDSSTFDFRTENEKNHTSVSQFPTRQGGMMGNKTGHPSPHHLTEKKEIRVWMDGAFDMMHFGHMNAFRQGRSLGTYLIAGINSDESITACKGPPVCNEKERIDTVKGCKWVDEVVEDVPYVMNDEYLTHIIEKYNIDYIVHGDDPCIVDGKNVYESAIKLGKVLFSYFCVLCLVSPVLLISFSWSRLSSCFFLFSPCSDTTTSFY